MSPFLIPLILFFTHITPTDVFVSGHEGYHTYRIPAVLTTAEGAVLAFAEGRETQSDQSGNDLLLKRSFDNGLTWGPLQIIAADGDNHLNNPTVVQVRETGRILLFYQRYPASRREGTVAAGWEGDSVCRAFVIHSDDEGASWSAPRDLTRQVKRPRYVTSLASGPGIGIQLRKGPHAGRILIPFNQGPWGDWRVYAVCSDDLGETWHMGETVPENSAGNGNEVQFVELNDGAVMLNSRGQAGHHLRKTAVSHDGGQTWTGLVNDPDLTEPECMGSILRYDDSSLLFINPASQTARVNGVLRASYDEGASWTVVDTVYDGSFAYSCLTRLANGQVGVLFERDDYGKISWVVVDF